MSIPETADLRPQFGKRGLEPRAQGKRGTCSIFAVVGVLEFELSAAGRGEERLSVEFLNWASHQTNHRTVDGSFFSDALVGVRQYGICAERLLPYAEDFDQHLSPPEAAREEALGRRHFTAEWIKEWDVKTGLSEQQLGAICRSLSEGHPVAVGLRWPKQAHYDTQHVLNLPPPADVFDGHSIVLVGYEEDTDPAHGGGTFIFRNSSGPKWEESGYARFSYAYARAYANDAVLVRLDADK